MEQLHDRSLEPFIFQRAGTGDMERLPLCRWSEKRPQPVTNATCHLWIYLTCTFNWVLCYLVSFCGKLHL